MKSFYTALAVFLLLLGLILCNSFYVRKASRELTKMIEAAPACEEAEAAVDDLYQYWKEHERILALSLPLCDIQSMSDCLAKMRAAVKTKNSEAFEEGRLLALDMLEHIGGMEKLSIDNLL